MHRFIVVPLLLAAVFYTAACGGSAVDERQTTKKSLSACIAHADVDEVGYPSRVRLWAENAGTTEIVSWYWRIGNTIHDASLTEGVFWLEIDKPGTINAELRGIDANGNSCSSPIKVKAKERFNAGPVVLFDGPQDFGEHEADGSDGTRYRYHEWRWSTARSYDPETEIVSMDWGIYGGEDLDGDGIPDTLYAGKTKDCISFSKLAGLTVLDGNDPNSMIVWVTPELTMSPLRVAVTATDTAAKPRRWGDGHVTLMK